MERSPKRASTPPAARVARRVALGLGFRELGIAAAALAVLFSVGYWSRKGRERAQSDELRAVQIELAMKLDAADLYRAKFDALQAELARTRALAEVQNAEPLRAWARERLHRMEAMVAQVNHEAEAQNLPAARKAIEQACAKGDIAAARARLEQLPDVTFPLPSEFSRLRRTLYEAPLAAFSRQNPTYYRALRQYDPELSREDERTLRADIAEAGKESVTPQVMFEVELLASVAAADDPVVTEWSAMTSAMDYFDNPDSATLDHWRQAQRAMRIYDWPTATGEMQAIVNSKVRTRQPFRAVFGKALLHVRPDQPTAYPFMAEAAASGDKEARAWVAQEDMRNQRYPQAQRWLEAAVADGDRDAVLKLVELYEKQQAVDPNRQAGVLERVTDREDASPAALVYLGRLYERTDPAGSRAKAFACYSRAAAKGSASGQAEVARCASQGLGTTENLDQARDAAVQAFAGGERNAAAEVLLELLHRAPTRAANAIQLMFEQESVAGGGGYTESRIVDGPGVAALKAQLAHYLDQTGHYAQAARLFAGTRDPAGARRHAELTATHVCETCGGKGKVQATAMCPTCGGKGRQICSYCTGSGFIYVPGTPPCAACGGTGTMVQDRKQVACSTCGGSGKGKGSVIKQDCTHCEHGYIRCPDCTGGIISVTKECPDCRGRGSWSLVDKSGD